MFEDPFEKENHSKREVNTKTCLRQSEARIAKQITLAYVSYTTCTVYVCILNKSCKQTSRFPWV